MLEVPVLNKSIRHSYSSINTFLDCERRYAIEKLSPFTHNEHTIRGNQIHDSLEWCMYQRVDGMALTVPELFDRAARDMPTKTRHGWGTWHEDERAVLSSEELRAWLTPVEGIFEKLYGARIEEWLARYELPGCELPLVGKADLISERLPDGSEGECVVDYKSVNSMEKSKTSWQLKRMLQPKVYALMTGIRDVVFVYWTPHHDPVVSHVTFTEQDMAVTELYLSEVCAAIEDRWKSGKFSLSATPGAGLCSSKWCPAWKECLGSAESGSGLLGGRY